MKAFTVSRYGKKSALLLAEVPTPDLRDDEVLIQVHAAGVNLIDSKIRNGEFKLILPYRTPFVLGHDVAGEVVKVGRLVRQFKPGDEVYSRPEDLRIGTFAEFVAVKESFVALKPKNLTMEEAASVPLVALTAWQALVEKAQLEARPKGLHPGWFWRRGHLCHPVGQASGRKRRNHHQHWQRGLGEGAWR